MEKPAKHGENQTRIAKKYLEASSDEKPIIWDCGSSLYDSFELKSFERQLDSAINNSRSLSMPHLSDRRVTDIHHQPPSRPQPISKKSSKISRSIHRLLRSVFKPKQNDTNNPFLAAQDGYYVVYEKSGVLSTIPEVPEFDGLSPEIKSLVRKTASDRFTVNSIGISCA